MTNGRDSEWRSLLMLASFIPVHAALDIVTLTNLNVSGSAIYLVFAGNFIVALAIVWCLFWLVDRARPSRTSIDADS